ncbi:MAG: two-component regulator propeller domain-containing protein [Flavihumibacter sp.]
MLHPKRTIALLLAILLLCYGKAALAQHYYFRHYQVENGLPNNTVNCILQDSSGFMWFGTKEGLCRFDGYHFRKIMHSRPGAGLPGTEFITSLYLDKKGRLWSGSNHGVFYYDEKKEELLPLIDSVAGITSITEDGSGQLWFTNAFNLYRYNFDSNKLTAYPSSAYFQTRHVCATPNGTILASTINGIVAEYLPATNSFKAYDLFDHSPPPVSKWIQCSKAINDSLVLVGTSNQGMKELNLHTGRYTDLLMTNAGKTSLFVREILEYEPGIFWLATELGLFILNRNNNQVQSIVKKPGNPYSLSDNAVYTLCKDHEGGIWAGTFFGGVNYFAKQFTAFEKYFPDNSLQSIQGNSVREITADAYGHLWVGTEDAGLTRIDLATGKMLTYLPDGKPGSISYSNIHGLAAIGNNLWIGTFEHGVDKMDITTGRVIKHYAVDSNRSYLKSNFILSFLQTKNGRLYAATSNGFVVYDPVADNFRPAPGAPESGFLPTTLEDHRGTIWIGGNNIGLFAYDPDKKMSTLYAFDAGKKQTISSNLVNALYEDDRNRLWIATDGGGISVLEPDRKTFSYYNTDAGLPSNFVFKVIQDRQGLMWATTSKGLVSIDPENSNVQVYTQSNGLLNDQFNYHSGYMHTDGSLYFGSIRGMIHFQPGNFSRNEYRPNLYITGLQVMNKDMQIDSNVLCQSILFTPKITLPHNQSSISLDFAALSFTSPQTTVYRYKLDGADKDWTELSTNRKVYFTNLSPGNYTFRVQAAINGDWTGIEKQLQIAILPPFWATAWAKIIYGLMAAAVCRYVLQDYHRRTQLKKEKEIYDSKIEFFTNVAHEIRTPLTLIKGPLDNIMEQAGQYPDITEDLEVMDKNTNRLLALVSQILDFRKTEAKGFRLEFSHENISALLRDSFTSFQSLAKKKSLCFELSVPADDLYAYVDEEALQKIFSNLLSNAVKYADKTVHIRLSAERTSACFQVECLNDGALIPADMHERIFEPFFRLKDSHRQKGTGVGLSLARSLAELLHGQLLLAEPVHNMNRFLLIVPLEQKIAEHNSLPATGSLQTI